MPFCLITGKFIPEKSNIWRDCVDGYYDWVKVGFNGVPLLTGRGWCIAFARGSNSGFMGQSSKEHHEQSCVRFDTLSQSEARSAVALTRAAAGAFNRRQHDTDAGCATQEHILDGAPLNEADHCGDPPLILAAGNGHLACVKLLLNEGADIEQRNVMKETPLIRAAHNGHLHTVRYLVQHGADVNALDLGENTALHWAAMRGHVEIVDYLCQQGSDKYIQNLQGKVPVDLCQPMWSSSYRFTKEVLAKY